MDIKPPDCWCQLHPWQVDVLPPPPHPQKQKGKGLIMLTNPHNEKGPPVIQAQTTDSSKEVTTDPLTKSRELTTPKKVTKNARGIVLETNV